MSTAMNNFSYLKDQIYQFQFFGKIRGLWILPKKNEIFFISGWVHKTLVSSKSSSKQVLKEKLSDNISSWKIAQNQRNPLEGKNKLDIFKSSFYICTQWYYIFSIYSSLKSDLTFNECDWANGQTSCPSENNCMHLYPSVYNCVYVWNGELTAFEDRSTRSNCPME
jgi:hypothetical protein